MPPEMLHIGETQISRLDGARPSRGGYGRPAGFDARIGCNRICAVRRGNADGTVPHLLSIERGRLWAGSKTRT